MWLQGWTEPVLCKQNQTSCSDLIKTLKQVDWFYNSGVGGAGKGRV
jgi:hypothetical protein